MYIAGFIVTGFVLAAVYAWGALRGPLGPLREDGARDPARGRRARRAGADRRRRLGRARRRREQPTKLADDRGPRRDDRGRAAPPARLVRRRGGRATGSAIPRMLSFLAYHDPNATRRRGSTRCPPTTGRPIGGQRHALRLPDDGRDRHGARRARRRSSLYVRIRKRRLPESRWFYRAVVARRAGVGRRADRRLGHDRGRPPAVGRLRA